MTAQRIAAALIAAGLSATPLHAQGYPERPVEVVLPYPAGGGIDLLVRVMAESYTAQLKQPFTVANRTGAGGAIGISFVARAAADGYTLLFAPALAYSVLPLMQASVGYTDKSFTPICQAFENQMALIVRTESPFKTARDIVEAAKTKPPAFAATAPGTITHLAAAALAETAKVKFNHVPFRGDAELMGQVLGGHVEFGTTTLASAAAAGPKIRVLGIFAEKRNPSVPDTPTIKEQGYDVAPTSFGGLFAPAGVPADAVAKLAAGCKTAVETPAYAALAKRLHQGTGYYADATAFTKRIETDVVEKRQLLQNLGLIK